MTVPVTLPAWLSGERLAAAPWDADVVVRQGDPRGVLGSPDLDRHRVERRGGEHRGVADDLVEDRSGHDQREEAGGIGERLPHRWRVEESERGGERSGGDTSATTCRTSPEPSVSTTTIVGRAVPDRFTVVLGSHPMCRS
jgi:hypothetical protein